MRNWIARLTLVALFLSAPALLRAQDSASLTGVVADASGAVMPGVTVVLTNKATGSKFTETTKKDGSYIFSSVPAADGYTAFFSRDGFATVTVEKLFLSVGKTRTLDEKLGIANTTENVNVSAANQEVTLNTTDASIGNNIDVQLLDELPVQDRTSGIATLFSLQPGVDFNSGAVTGARIDQTEVTVDGLDVNDIAAGSTFAIVGNAPIDSIDQFSGTVAGLIPAVGTGSGAQYQLVTKTGSNKFHGLLYEYHRDTTTVANEYFNNLNGLPRTPLIRNQFGGNFGGPILKDKLFFFFDVSASRIIQSFTGEDTVPLSNLTSATPTLNYVNSGPGCNAQSRLNTSPNCISSLSSAQVAALDPAGIGFDTGVLGFIAGRYPAANDLTQGDGINTGGYRFTVPGPDILTTYVAKLDYNLTPHQHIFVRGTINRQNALQSLPVFPSDPVTHPFIDRSYGYVVSHVWTISNNKVNQFYYGDTISKYNFPNAYNPTGVNAYSFSGLSSPYSGTDGQKRRVPIPEIRDDFNWSLGSHSLVMGGTFKFIKTNSNLINNFNFVAGGLTGGLSAGFNPAPGDPNVRPGDLYNDPNVQNNYDSLFATTLGTVGSISTNFNYDKSGGTLPAAGGGPRAYRYFETELYAGDSWRVTPKLTLTYGLRYQLYSVPYEAHGEESVEEFTGATQQTSTLTTYVKDRIAQQNSGDTSNTGLPIYSVILGGKANNGPNLYAPSYKDIAPRLAFAYHANPHTVINGSGAVVYDRTVINAINFLQDQISYLFSNGVTNNLSPGDPIQALKTVPRFGGCGAPSATCLGTANLTVPSPAFPVAQPLAAPYTPYVAQGQPYGLAEGATNFVISPNLKDPYSLTFNVGIQQQMPFNIVLKANYVGRLGRRLLADADAGQVIDVPDYTGQSTQSMAQAFAAITTQLRAGVPVGSLTSQPWFEHVLGGGSTALAAASGLPDNTNLAAAMAGVYATRGDISDAIYIISQYSDFYGYTGFLPTNIGIPSQFGSNAYLNNEGNSSYNGLLLTITKNTSHGLRVDLNYTWSHSIDNTSLSANGNALFSNSGFICDITKPRACRGSSDFDVTQIVTGDFVYKLPVGRGQTFLSNAPLFLEEAIGGWSISGIPSFRTGLGVTPFSDAYLASFDNNDPAIYIGHNKGDLKSHVNKVGKTVYGFAGGQAGADKALADFRGPIGLEYGSRNIIRGPVLTNLDIGLGKIFPIVPKDNVVLKFQADAFNIFNHANFSTPGVNILGNQQTFGQISGTVAALGNNQSARVAQFSLRLEF